MSDERIVIVGGGLAGARAAETLREEGFDGTVVLLAAEDVPPYERPLLSKEYLLGDKPASDGFVHDAGWYADHDIDLRTGTTVVSLDLEAHRVRTESGEDVEYDRLLVATGSGSRRVDVPGVDLDGVLTLRTMAEAERLKAALDDGGPLVIVGAGWIGLEVAAAARHADVAVTVLDTADVPLQNVLGPRMGDVFAALHRRHGVDLRMGTGISEIVGDGTVTGVVTDDGTRIDAATVLVAVGAVPLTGWALDAGLDGDGGIDVDASLKTSHDAVWAAGDVAAIDYPSLGTRLRTEHWATALDTGPAAARSLLGQDVTYDQPPYFFTDQYDLGMEYVGHVDAGRADVVVRGSTDDTGDGLAFTAFWLVDGTVRAAMHVNEWDTGVDPLKALLGRQVDPGRLADPDVAYDQL